jgi:hypothetical protein
MELSPTATGSTPQIPGICIHHPGVIAHRACDRCRLPYCEDCLVTIGGKTLCAGCKLLALRDTRRRGGDGQAEANSVFTMSLVGLVIFQVILSPMALLRSLALLRRYREVPDWPGRAKARSAAIISGVAVGIVVVYLLFLVGMAVAAR